MVLKRFFPPLCATWLAACSTSPAGEQLSDTTPLDTNAPDETSAPPTDAAEGPETAADTGEVSVAPLPESVDIVFAAGPLAADAGCYFTKDAQSAKGCSLYRVAWSVSEGRALGAALVVGGDGAGYWLASASPDGAQLVYARRDPAGTVDIFVRTLSVDDPTDPGKSVVAAAAPAPRIWTWPHWLDATRLAVSHVATDALCAGPTGDCSPLERWQAVFEIDTAASPLVPPTPLMGAGADVADFASTEDAYRHPTSGRYVASHGKEARLEAPPTTACLAETPLCQSDITVGPTPRVVDLETGDVWTWELETTWRGASLRVGGCAHLAFSPSGKSLICTIQATPETGEQSDLLEIPFDPSAPPGARIVKVVAAPFVHPPAESLFTLAAGEACNLYFTKYAEFCGSDDLIVASVACACTTQACTANPAAPKVIGSRVVLIDRRDPALPVYADLTAHAAAVAGLDSADFGGFTATCLPRR
jgi:hypothetical protein